MRVSRLAIVTAVVFPLFAQQQPPQQPPQVQAGRTPRAGGRGSMVPPLEESGFHPIFDGKSLAGWDCDPNFWKVSDGKKVGVMGSVGDNAELKALIKNEDWNEIHIIARGNTIIQMVNGHVMSMLVDDDKANRKMSGLIGVQLHKTTGPMKIETKDIRLKEF